MASSHFGLTPARAPDLLGSPFLGCFDRTDRPQPKSYERPPLAAGLDLGLKDEHVLEIYQALEQHRVLVIVAPTGAGKSTVIPHRLLNPLLQSGLAPDHFTSGGRQIVVTQPRRVAASDIPDTIATRMHGGSVGPGAEIGYRHGTEREQFDGWNRLLFVTDGTLANWLAAQRAREFSVIVVDEAHERSTTIDLILSLMRDELLRQADLKLIILSATIHADSFVAFYEEALPGQVWLRDFAECEKSYGYKVIWPDGPDLEPDDAVRALAKKVTHILETTSEGGILGFLPGEREIEDAIAAIREQLPPELAKRTTVLPMHGKLSKREVEAACGEVKSRRDRNGKAYLPRRVVIATNIAETSLTIPDVTHVVDSGLIKESTWDSATLTETLERRWHSQAGCRQRWGRAGRNRPGEVHPLYPKKQYERLEPHTTPAIQRECLDEVLIRAKRAGAGALDDLPWLDAPKDVELKRVSRMAEGRGFVDEDADLTARGAETFDLYQRISRFMPEGAGASSRTLDMASLLVLADRHGCLPEALTVLVLARRMGENIYRREQGLLRFSPAWSLEEIDWFCLTQESLRAGCQDDLDFALKLAALAEGCEIDGAVLGGAPWVERCQINWSAMEQALSERDELLNAFIREGVDRGTRKLDLRLAGRLRLLVASAWPDKHITVGQATWRHDLDDHLSGEVSAHSVASSWAEPVPAILLSCARQDRPSIEGNVPTAVADFVIRRPDGIAAADLSNAVRRERMAMRAEQPARLFQDQIHPPGSPAPGQDGKIVCRWANNRGEPKADLETLPSSWEPGRQAVGDPVNVAFIRPIWFAPTREIMGLVADTERGRLYIGEGDLSVSPENPDLARLCGTSATLTLVEGRSGVPKPSLLPYLEPGLGELRERRRLGGRLLGLDTNQRGDTLMKISVANPGAAVALHVVTSVLPRRREHLGSLSVGRSVFLTLREARDSRWTRMLQDPPQPPLDDVMGALQRLGVDGGQDQLTCGPAFDWKALSGATAIAPQIQRALRLLYAQRHALWADPESIDTADSDSAGNELLDAARQVWRNAWVSAPGQVCEAVKGARATLKETQTSFWFKRQATVLLDEAWEIQSARYALERGRAEAADRRRQVSEQQAKFTVWNTSMQQRISELRDRIANAKHVDQLARLNGYLRDNEKQLHTAMLELPGRKIRWEQSLRRARELEEAASAAEPRLRALRARDLTLYSL